MRFLKYAIRFFQWWDLLGFFKNGLRFFCVFSIFFPKTRNCFEKSRRLPYPDLILKGFSGFCPALYSVFDPKTDTKRKLPEKNKTIFFRHFSGFFKKCRRKNGKNTENKILKFRLLSVFCPSFLFLKFDIKNGLRF